MARYLVIEFKDNSQAEKLMAQVDAATEKGAAYRVVGLFVRPGGTCQCWNWNVKNYRDPDKARHSGGVERGEKFGWWVCTDCGKPRKSGHTLENQLEVADTFFDPVTRDEYEFRVSNLSIVGLPTTNVKRSKRKRKPKDGKTSST